LIRKFYGELEVDTDRGVVYFHVDPAQLALRDYLDKELVAPTLLRICRLQGMPDNFTSIDITNGWGVSYQRANYDGATVVPITF